MPDSHIIILFEWVTELLFKEAVGLGIDNLVKRELSLEPRSSDLQFFCY